ncbi:hypothetical protein R84981_000989 [Carnimonas sp. R-84981]|uniref:host specificity factor TipJ family phage tail protein n=1 Tax=Carnimonas bestiolae TaxID=3402172 RepID=UPI003EDBECCF
MIEIFPTNILESDALEKFTLSDSMTLSEWVHNTKSLLWQWLIPTDENSPGLPAFLPVVVVVNGSYLPEEAWNTRLLMPADRVKVSFTAQGSLVSGLFNAVTSVINSVFKIFIRTPSLPGNANFQQSGDQIDIANLKANQPKLNSPIREAFGRNRIYPDYVVHTRQLFQGSEQYSLMHLCVGVGRYLINPAEVVIANTPLTSFGSDASLQIFGPGDDITGNPACENWYPVPEVGNTSSGAAGLALRQTFAVATNPNAGSYTLGSAGEGAGGIVSIPSGAGAFPDGWAAGMEVAISAALDVTFGSDESGANYLVGPADNVDYEIGNHVIITGDIEGAFKISTRVIAEDGTHYGLTDDSGNPITWIGAGQHTVKIAQSGQRFRITDTDARGSYDPEADEQSDDYAPAQQITVQRIDANGDIDAQWAGFDSRSGTEFKVTLTDDSSDGGWQGPFRCCPEGEVTTRIEYDLMWQQGLNIINPKGKNRQVRYRWQVRYRDSRLGGAWTYVEDSYQDSTNDQRAITRAIDLTGAINPEVSIRKLEGDYNHDELGQLYDDCDWYGLRARLNRPSSYAGVTTIAVRIRTGERLAAQSENQVWCYATRMLPPFDGAEAAPTATRDIAPAMMYIARQRGYSDADVDMSELRRLQAIWTSRGDYFDMQFTDETSVKDAINTALGVGFAELTNDYGPLVPVRDEPRSNFDHMYTPQNMTAELKIAFNTINCAASDVFDGLTVEFNNIATGEKETVPCLLPGDSGEKMDTQTVYGITDRLRAYRWGMRRRAVQVYRDMTFEAQTGFDALNSRYLDYCQMSGDYSEFEQSGFIHGYIVAGEKMTLRLDRSLNWHDGQQHVISLRAQDGLADGPYAAERGDSDDEVVINTPRVTPNMDPVYDLTQYAFGIDNRTFWPVLVQSVSPSGSPVGDQEPQVTIQAVNYDERVYAYDDAYPS